MQIILSEPLREPDNHNSGDSIALLSGVAYATSDKVYYRNRFANPLIIMRAILSPLYREFLAEPPINILPDDSFMDKYSLYTGAVTPSNAVCDSF